MGNLLGIFWDRKNGVASQWSNSVQKENNSSGQNFTLGNGIFLENMESYDDEKMREKIGCFTTDSVDLIPQIKKRII